MTQDVLTQLASVLEERKHASPDSSYVAKLYSKGLDAILKKIGEEATETVMAAKDQPTIKLCMKSQTYGFIPWYYWRIKIYSPTMF